MFCFVLTSDSEEFWERTSSMGRFVHEKLTQWSPYRLISVFVFMFQVMFFMFGLPFNKLKCENVTKLEADRSGGIHKRVCINRRQLLAAFLKEKY